MIKRDAHSNRWQGNWPRLGLAACLLGVGADWTYSPLVHAEFLPFDDQEYVFLNPNVANGFSYESVVWAFTRVSVSNWHPLTWLSHMLDAALFDLDPRGHHAMSIGWHTANVVLLFLVMTYLTGRPVPSFFLAALFALHPTHVEAVAWVAQRKTLISTFLIFLTIAAYSTYLRQQSRSWYWASLVIFAASLMAKQTFVTLPLLLVLVDYWPLRRGLSENISSWKNIFAAMWKQLPDKLPFALVSVVAAFITVVAQTTAMQSLEGFPIEMRLGNVCIAFCRYLAGIFWPTNLSIYYTIHMDSITIAPVIGSMLILLTLSAVAFFNRSRPYLLTGWFWFLISMLPVIGIVHVGLQSMADRYLYNASFGILVVIVWLVLDLLDSSRRKLGSDKRLFRVLNGAAIAAALLVILSLATVTHRRCIRWQTVVGTFQEAIDHDPTNWLAHRILAEKFIDLGEYDQAVYHAEKALDQVEDSGFYVLQAIASRELDDRQSAVQLLERAIEINENDALAFSLLAVLFSELGQFERAQQMLEAAETRFPLPENQVYRRVPVLILRNCGIALLSQNRPLEAVQRFQAAQELDPRDIGLTHELAQAEMRANRIQQAIERLEQIRVRQPDHAQNLNLLGKAHKQLGNLSEAEKWFRRAVDLEPTETLFVMQLGDILLHTGRVAEAQELLGKALAEVTARKESRETSRRIGELNTQLGDVGLATGDLPAALLHYRTAIANWPEQHTANNNLAWLLATEPDPGIRNPEEAVRLAEHAVGLPRGKENGSLGTLAAAYAAAGRIEEAVQTAEEAIRLAKDDGSAASVIDQLQRQLELHRKGEALVESVLRSQ